MNKLYKITKIGKVENPVHPYSDFGESMPYHKGYFTASPVIGERFNLSPLSYRVGEVGISTSPVTKIIDESTFETLNSIYRYEPIAPNNDN